MDASQFNQNGNYTALAGVIVMVLARFGISSDVGTVLTIAAGVVALAGIAKQIYTHATLKKVALSTGAIR